MSPLNERIAQMKAESAHLQKYRVVLVVRHDFLIEAPEARGAIRLAKEKLRGGDPAIIFEYAQP